MVVSTILASSVPAGPNGTPGQTPAGSGSKLEVPAERAVAGVVPLEVGVVVVGLHRLGQLEIDLAGVAAHELLPADPACHDRLPDVRLVHSGFEAEQLQILGDVRADEVAVLLLLERDVLQPQLQPGDLVGVDVAQSQALA